MPKKKNNESLQERQARLSHNPGLTRERLRNKMEASKYNYEQWKISELESKKEGLTEKRDALQNSTRFLFKSSDECEDEDEDGYEESVKEPQPFGDYDDTSYGGISFAEISIDRAPTDDATLASADIRAKTQKKMPKTPKKTPKKPMNTPSTASKKMPSVAKKTPSNPTSVSSSRASTRETPMTKPAKAAPTPTPRSSKRLAEKKRAEEID